MIAIIGITSITIMVIAELLTTKKLIRMILLITSWAFIVFGCLHAKMWHFSLPIAIGCIILIIDTFVLKANEKNKKLIDKNEP